MREGSVGKPGSWWVELVYADTLCGQAQIIRDPHIGAQTRLNINDSYFGMPEPMGACNVLQKPITMPTLNEAERKLLNLGDDIDAEDV